MTTDPQIVQQLATEHILDDARRAHDIGAAVLGHFGPDALTKHEYGAWCSAIREAITTATVAVSWPDEQPQDERDDIHTASAAANLRVWLDSRNAADTLGRDVRAVLDNREQWRNLALSRGTEREQLRPEFGVRADFLDTTTAEFTVADNLGDALRALDEFDARHGDKVLSRELVERPVGEWRKVGGESVPQQPERGGTAPMGQEGS